MGQWFAEGNRRRSCDAVTEPLRPKFGGPHARAYVDDPRCTEGSCWRSVSYTENVAISTVFLAGWSGRPYADGPTFSRRHMSRLSAPSDIPLVLVRASNTRNKNTTQNYYICWQSAFTVVLTASTWCLIWDSWHNRRIQWRIPQVYHKENGKWLE
jgi:hypothetical protein